MSDTASLKLPLLQPSQAQKHVTVNEALVRIDGLAQLRLQSASLTVAPASPIDGACYAVPPGASGDWVGRDGLVAIASNGGWIFVEPKSGWTGWLVDEMVQLTFVGGAWQRDVLAIGASGAATRMVVDEVVHEVQAGGAQAIALTIPANAMVFACSARVSADITGTASAWSLGVAGESAKFGSGMGLHQDSYCTGILSQPTTYYVDTGLVLTPEGGDFSAGQLKLALHRLHLELPA